MTTNWYKDHMRLKTILFVFLVTANTYAYDMQENDENDVSTPAMDLNNEDYGSMITSLSASREPSSFPEDSMANFANNDDDNEY